MSYMVDVGLICNRMVYTVVYLGLIAHTMQSV